MDLDNAKPPALPVAQIKESGDYEEGVGVGEQIAIIMENRFLIFLITILFVIKIPLGLTLLQN